MSKKVKIGVITDIHYGDKISISARQGQIGDILLLRTVHRLNRMIKPDITLILGDILDDPDSRKSGERLAKMQEILNLLESPWMAIPGNHDPVEDRFYKVIDRPPVFMDIKGVRFVPFIDPEELGWNAKRLPENIEKMKKVRSNHDGPIVAFQHVPLFPPNKSDCCYNYTNIDEVLEAIWANNFTLSIGGHYHAGTELIRDGNHSFVVGKSLCESPFSFMEINLDSEDIQVTHHEHQMPPKLELFDYHSHTQFAYCSENMDMVKSPELAEKFGLRGIAFTEHSGQLYFDRQTYWSGELCQEGIKGTKGLQDRMPDFWLNVEEVQRDNLIIGFEVDSDFQGNMILQNEDQQRAQLLNGAIHQLPELRKEKVDLKRATDEYLRILECFVQTGIQILAHPFRIFRSHEVPTKLFVPVIRMLRENNVAAEMNFHFNRPQPEFVKMCVEAGVKITFGSDAHNLYEVGEFAPHLKLLDEIGYKGDLKDIMARID